MMARISTILITTSANINTANTLSFLPLSPPLSSSLSQLQSRNGNGQQHGKSPHNPPPAPVHTTIPLPEVDLDQHNWDERAPYVERRQFQHRYQPMHHHEHKERGYGLVQGDTIDITGLNISSAPRQRIPLLLHQTKPSHLRPILKLSRLFYYFFRIRCVLFNEYSCAGFRCQRTLRV